MTIGDLAKSYVRTIVPAVVGAIIAWALHHGHDIHGYEAQITAVVTAAYYGLARLLEHYVSPKFGWLLGVAQKPLYGAVGHLKVKKGRTADSHVTVHIHGDATDLHAALDKVSAHAKQVAAEVAKAQKTTARKPRKA